MGHPPRTPPPTPPRPYGALSSADLWRVPAPPAPGEKDSPDYFIVHSTADRARVRYRDIQFIVKRTGWVTWGIPKGVPSPLLPRPRALRDLRRFHA